LRGVKNLMTCTGDVNAQCIEDTDVTGGGKYLVYQIFVGIAGIIVIIILVGLAGYVLGKFGLSGIFGRGFK